MKDASTIASTAKKTMLLESNTIANLVNLLNSTFIKGINFIYKVDKTITTLHYSSIIVLKNRINYLNPNNSLNFTTNFSFILIKKGNL